MRSNEDLLRPFAAVVRSSMDFFVSDLGTWYLFVFSKSMNRPVRKGAAFKDALTVFHLIL